MAYEQVALVTRGEDLKPKATNFGGLVWPFHPSGFEIL